MNGKLKSYLVRAIYDYCIHHGYDPYVIVAKGGSSIFPGQNDQQETTITLNLSNDAIRDFQLDDGYMTFSTRFNGQVTHVDVCIDEIVWIGSPGVADAGLAFKALLKSEDSERENQEAEARQHQIGNTKLRLL